MYFIYAIKEVFYLYVVSPLLVTLRNTPHVLAVVSPEELLTAMKSEYRRKLSWQARQDWRKHKLWCKFQDGVLTLGVYEERHTIVVTTVDSIIQPTQSAQLQHEKAFNTSWKYKFLKKLVGINMVHWIYKIISIRVFIRLDRSTKNLV